MNAVLHIDSLKTHFFTDSVIVKAVDGATLRIERDETLGLVGESGCGKSTLALSILKLLPRTAKIVDGKILFNRMDLVDTTDREIRTIRGRQISMIFQDPMVALNPVFTVSDQIGETIKLHQSIEKNEISSKVIESLKKVQIADPESVCGYYPHQLSGGMRQRVMIAMALACEPSLLIADEPTTSLDVTIQAQILDLIRNWRKDSKSSILLITHDLGVVAEMADKTAVMYAGRVVEYSDTAIIFRNPKHPYTEALLNSFPRIDRKVKRLAVIPGRVPSLTSPSIGCKFHPRCIYGSEICRTANPELVQVEKGHHVACVEQNSVCKDRCL